MTDARLRELRRAVRAGAMPEDLVAELRAVAHDLARRTLLPPSLAPYGVWDQDAADDLFGDWYASRLLGRGHALALLDRARTAAGFRRLAERSLRQHLLNARDRSQAQNLYERTVALLRESPRFEVVRAASRSQDEWFGLAGADVAPWHGPERELVAAAWALGDFTVIRYRASAAKLSPVLDAEALERFVGGLMARTSAALTPRLLMDALSARFDLAPPRVQSLEEGTAPTSGERLDVEVVLRDTARALVAGLTERQREVLRRSGDETVAVLAAVLGCSPATIVNEQRRVGEAVTRMSEDQRERGALLNITRDLVYLATDE